MGGVHSGLLHIHHHVRHNAFVQTNLVSDQPGVAPTTDSALVNPWGLAASPHSVGGPWWVNDNGTGLSTLYSGAGAKQTLEVTIPPPHGSAPGTHSAPTGIVFNNTSDFVVTSGTQSAPSFFIFATEDGTLSAWNPTVGVPPVGTPPSMQAFLVADNSSADAVYKGLAMASSRGANYVYATDFHNGKVDVFDGQFAPHTFSTHQFTDPRLPRGYAPFGIANIRGNLFVTYAKQDADKEDDVAGRGNGFVDEFSPTGRLIQRVAIHGTLNSPWGMVVAPSSFGQFRGDLLVGNFGDGRISAFRPVGHGHFKFDGQLRDPQGQPVTIDGLWGLAVGNNAQAGPSSTVFFTAGPDDESHGLFGTLTRAR